MKASCLVREVRPIDVDGLRGTGRRRTPPVVSAAAPDDVTPVDMRIVDGTVTEVGPGLTRQDGETVHEGGGRWALPGLWDAHVHLGQWSALATRFDLSEARSVAEVASLVAHQVAMTPRDKPFTVCGFGYRTATWPEQPTVAALDAVSREIPIVLISGDCHSGWLNSVALGMLGLDFREGIVFEQEWFDVFPLLESRLPGLAESTIVGYRAAVADAASRGITGVVDLEFARGFEQWPSRFTDHGIDGLRVRVGTYADALDDLVATGLRTGDTIGDSDGLVQVGSLKIISDGSLNTRTAYCCEPYADGAGLPHPRGVQNVDFHELRRLLTTARTNGLTVALHAIGDAAVQDALDAFEITGATGSVEHAQLMSWEDIPRMGRLGVTASVQPAHLWDDRDVARQCWPDRVERCFPFRSLTASGVRLALGSDAPVSPLDPWLAIAAAIHRSSDARDPWVPHQSLTTAEALAASVDGQGTVAPGSRGDVVLLDRHPLAVPEDSREAAASLREMRAAATILAGRLTHG